MLTPLRRLLQCVVHLCRWLLHQLRPYPRFYWPSPRAGGPRRRPHAPPKPTWVRQEIIRLKALMPAAGCRTIAHCFNRRFAISKGMTVGKTYVADTMRKHHYPILAARRKMKHAVPHPLPHNLIWGLDLTGKRDAQGRTQYILGLLDHASRACLTLTTVTDKSARTLLGHVIHAVRQFGQPRSLRTDNEPIWTAPVFRLGLWLLGIRHQRTEPHCPWQNGRIERFFGTVKRALADEPSTNSADLDAALAQVRQWYNHVRPHDHLHGRTPAEVWAGIDVFATRSGQGGFERDT